MQTDSFLMEEECMGIIIQVQHFVWYAEDNDAEVIISINMN